MQWSTKYHDNFSCAFPKGTQYSAGFELGKSASPPPKLDVILVTGNTNTTTQSICAQFGQEFGFYHIDTQEYLRVLAEQGENARPAALGLLHPLALKQFLDAEQNVPAFFLLIVERVKQGQTRFMISGLDEDAETAIVFAEKIKEPAALFSLIISVANDPEDALAGAQMSDIRASIEEHYADIVVKLESADDEAAETGYRKLFAAISKKACSVPEVKMGDAEMARADSVVRK
ncbi:hypothetical protein LTR85_004084 [Meristemomyces frigidus]|nr:hypothetical protein LTR85_004084 [Meristemomyces frigidus]